ncbi:hypothetical protein [Streptomyces sp. NBC_01321]|uniref:hypothetical protein n=1 Tax=Streptomyces sp. NBC_01321 TaxID=2903825 RepID=UPI003FA34B09
MATPPGAVHVRDSKNVRGRCSGSRRARGPSSLCTRPADPQPTGAPGLVDVGPGVRCC